MNRLPIDKRGTGFTLIELLIVVAIIAILAAIAVPNFLEAQTRAKIARTKADMRSFATAAEAYAIDWNSYPIGNRLVGRGGVDEITSLTTPVAYITSVNLIDPFNQFKGYNSAQFSNKRATMTYNNVFLSRKLRDQADSKPELSSPQWMIYSYGPDQVKGPNPLGGGWANSRYFRNPPAPFEDDHRFGMWYYDSTNGTQSNGDIMRWH